MLLVLVLLLLLLLLLLLNRIEGAHAGQRKRSVAPRRAGTVRLCGLLLSRSRIGVLAGRETLTLTLAWRRVRGRTWIAYRYGLTRRLSTRLLGLGLGLRHGYRWRWRRCSRAVLLLVGELVGECRIHAFVAFGQ